MQNSPTSKKGLIAAHMNVDAEIVLVLLDQHWEDTTDGIELARIPYLATGTSAEAHWLAIQAMVSGLRENFAIRYAGREDFPFVTDAYDLMAFAEGPTHA